MQDDSPDTDQNGCIIESIRSKARLHLGRESKRLGVVNLRKKNLCRIGGQLCIVGVDEPIEDDARL